MDHSSFLQAILDRPDDDDVRLLWSDWLDEHGEADRAEFLRTQIVLARLPEDDPRRPELLGREAFLLAHHAKEWGRPVRGLARRWEFRRGCLEGVTLPAARLLACGDELLRRAPLRHLHLTGLSGDLTELADYPHWGRVRELTLGLHPSTTLLPSILAYFVRSPHVPPLHSLDLAQGTFLPDALPVLAALPSLVTLALNVRHRPAVASPLPRWGRWPALRRLRLYPGAYLPDLVQDLLPQLEVLNLTGCWMAAEEFSRLVTALPSLSLRALLLNSLTIQDAAQSRSGAVLATRLPLNLYRLEVRNNSLGPDFARSLASNPHARRLTHLDVGFNPLGLDALQALATSPHLALLTHLGLAHIGLPPDVVPTWPRLLDGPTLPRLAALDLRGNNLDARAAETLARSSLASRLVRLDLRHNRLGDDGAWALYAVDWPRLAWLDVRDNGLGPAARTMLRQRFGYVVHF